MELQFLHMIQGLHNEILDNIMIILSALGEGGIFWIALSVILVIPKKTRRCGITMMISMALTFILGNLVLKNLIARPRPFVADPSVNLIVPVPREYSFPSGHTMNGFTAATSIFLYYKKAGIGALVFAAAIAFSRMYLFVHYPTDILGGIAVGVLDAVVSYLIVKRFAKKLNK